MFSILFPICNCNHFRRHGSMVAGAADKCNHVGISRKAAANCMPGSIENERKMSRFLDPRSHFVPVKFHSCAAPVSQERTKERDALGRCNVLPIVRKFLAGYACQPRAATLVQLSSSSVACDFFTSFSLAVMGAVLPPLPLQDTFPLCSGCSLQQRVVP